MSNFTNKFTGAAVKPSQVSYEALTISANTQLYWPTETAEGVPYVATTIDVTATTTGLSVLMPSALQGSTGQATVITNVGTNSFTLTDQSGAQIAVIAAGISWLINLTDNTTANGTWRALQLAATTSSAQASALAGAGLQAIGSLLQTLVATTTLNTNLTLITSAYRANAIVWTGGTGTLQLDTIANLTAGFYGFISNQGTGPLTITTSSSQTINGQASLVIPQGTTGQYYSCLIICAAGGFYAFGLTPTPTQIANGGTGATTAETALENFGGTALGISIFTAANAAAIIALLGLSSAILTESSVGTNVNPAVSGTAYVGTAAITINLPLTTTLTHWFIVAIFAQGGAVTIIPNSADAINGGSAGTSYVLPKGASTLLVTDANGNWWPLFTASAAEATLASAATTDLGSVSSSVIQITGTTGITSFGSSASTKYPLYYIRFAGALKITYNATSMILPGAADLNTSAGDTAVMQYLGSGNWLMREYFNLAQNINIVQITSTQTYTPSVWARRFAVTLTAAGGNGGQGGNGAASSAASGGSGGAGETRRMTYTAAQMGATAAVTLGAVGSNSTFVPAGSGASLTAVCGSNGSNAASQTPGTGGTGGTGGSGGVGYQGGPGAPGTATTATGANSCGVNGGASFWGGGGKGGPQGTSGSAASVPGAGGGSGGGDSASSPAGGSGAAAVCEIIEFP